ncbi:MAG TPA: tetratricopeptide repeat protein, partial [Mariniphaga sp.]|nr:tetratricopeptide repeat protein [Mariniphaga sp.]
EAPEAFNWSSIYGQYIDGVNWIYQGNYERAKASLENCLVQDPYYAPALNHLAELYIRKGDLNYAKNLVQRSLSINTYDPKANFIYGLVNRMTGNLIDAQDGFAVASVSPEYRMAAYLEQAKLFLLTNELNKAKTYAVRVLDGDAKNQEALLIQAVVLRKLDRKEEANNYLNQLELISPLNHFVRAERMFLDDQNERRDDFTSLIRNELAYQTYMEVALWYQNSGCVEEAISILELSPENTLVNLQLSYLFKYFDEEQSKKYFNYFINGSPDFIFPFRYELFPVLNWATRMSDDWKPGYFLALLHWSKGNREIAKEIFTSLEDIPQYPYFYLARNELLSEDKEYNAEKDLKKAQELGSTDWRTSLAVIDYYLSKNKVSEALDASTKSMQLFPEIEALKYTYAKSLLANGRYSESLNELENTVILPHEGARHGRITYRQAAVMASLQHYKNENYDEALSSIAKARLWPENLGVGQPFEVDERIEDFLEAEYLMKLNKKDQADALYQKILKYNANRGGRINSTDYLYLVVLQRLGELNQVETILNQWEQRSSDDSLFQWIQAMIENNRDTAKQIEKEIDTGSEGSPWDPGYSDSEFELIKAIAYKVSE